jgi:predicted NBD/HSP70 family sugar kinase
MGTGIGAGVLIDGIVFRGSSSNAGELGQIIVTGPNGEKAVLEEVADPGAVVARARATGDATRLRLPEDDDFGGFRAIATAAARGDEGASALIEESADHLASGDLDSVSLAGPAFAVAGPTYVRAISHRLEAEFFVRTKHGIRVRLSTDVSDAAAVGGAALVLQTELAPRTMGLTAFVGD